MFSLVAVWNPNSKKYDVTVGLRFHLIGVPSKMLGELVDKFARLYELDPGFAALERAAQRQGYEFFKA